MKGNGIAESGTKGWEDLHANWEILPMVTFVVLHTDDRGLLFM
jgi:hypothetical protein